MAREGQEGAVFKQAYTWCIFLSSKLAQNGKAETQTVISKTVLQNRSDALLSVITRGQA